MAAPWPGAGLLSLLGLVEPTASHTGPGGLALPSPCVL